MNLMRLTTVVNRPKMSKTSRMSSILAAVAALTVLAVAAAPSLHGQNRPDTRTRHGLQQTSQSWTKWPLTSGSR